MSISIHALLAESDQSSSYSAYLGEGISIHALLAESDQLYINGTAETIIFLSTLSLRRATWAKSLFRYLDIISIHALLAESDPGILARQ